MSEAFDPYYRWLGIPPKDQPPNHYRLLSVELFEADPSVIEAAADRQMGHLRTYQAGRHADLSQRLLNEVATAKICLLNPQRKPAYDARLREQLEQPGGVRDPALGAEPLDRDLAGVIEQAERRSFARPFRGGTRARQSATGMLLGLCVMTAAACLLVVGLFVWQATTSRDAANKPVAQTGPGPVEPKTVDLTDEPTIPGPAKPEPAPGKGLGKGLGKEPGKGPDNQTGTPPMEPPGGEAEPSGDSEHSQGSEGIEFIRPEDPSGTPAPPGKGPPGPGKSPPPGASQEEAERLPVPAEADQEKSRKLALEIYQKDMEKAKTPAERTALAKRLIQDAGRAKSDPAGRFILLVMAREVAGGAGDAETAFQAVDELEARFEIDPLATKAELAEQLLKLARAPAEQRAAAEKALAVAEEALADDNFEVSNRLLKPAQAVAGKSRADELRERIRLKIKQCQEAEKSFTLVEQARETLKTRPEDPEANLALGKYLCFVKEDWDGGLPKLALTGDAVLKSLAEKEAAGPASVEDRLALADAWWDRAEKGEAGRPFRQRAGFWYRVLRADLPEGLLRGKVQKRLDELAASEAASRPASGAKKSYLKLYAGTWIIGYANGTGRRYVIDDEGGVVWGKRRARLTGRGADLIIDFGDDKLERVRIAARHLQIEHFDPAAHFPRKPTLLAIGQKIRIEKGTLEEICRTLQGTWTIKYANKVTSEYNFDDKGNVLFVNVRRRGSVTLRDGSLLIDFNDGRLERLEVRGPWLYLEKFTAASQYPHTIDTFGSGARKR